jgi:type II secretory pathway pseudopilin PulG
MFLNFIKLNKNGFSILEAVIAIYVLTMGLLGIMSLMTQGLQVQQINKNAIISSQLAQEGLELVRNQRDVNWKTSGADWERGVSAFSKSDIIQDGSYEIDYDKNGGIVNVNSIDDAILNINPVNGFYWHGAGAPTIFKRLITATDHTDYLDVVCTIKWNDRGNVKTYAVESLLYNWR